MQVKRLEVCLPHSDSRRFAILLQDSSKCWHRDWAGGERECVLGDSGHCPRLGWRGMRVHSGGQWTLPHTGLEGNESTFWGTRQKHNIQGVRARAEWSTLRRLNVSHYFDPMGMECRTPAVHKGHITRCCEKYKNCWFKVLQIGWELTTC